MEAWGWELTWSEFSEKVIYVSFYLCFCLSGEKKNETPLRGLTELVSKEGSIPYKLQDTDKFLNL